MASFYSNTPLSPTRASTLSPPSRTPTYLAHTPRMGKRTATLPGGLASRFDHTTHVGRDGAGRADPAPRPAPSFPQGWAVKLVPDVLRRRPASPAHCSLISLQCKQGEKNQNATGLNYSHTRVCLRAVMWHTHTCTCMHVHTHTHTCEHEHTPKLAAMVQATIAVVCSQRSRMRISFAPAHDAPG